MASHEDEDFVALGSVMWTEIMFEYLRREREQLIVVDAEDMVNDGRALLDKVGQRLGTDPAGLKDEWTEGFDVSNGWSMEDEISRHSAEVLNADADKMCCRWSQASSGHRA
ncbi:hypothetical protein AC578_6160 [Pseudocercospora eumusae]|uniref:Uncharacterized protein n=1 Tax=Pseudocercospora eumusae TaxID=321146 RepID=A0A139H978_9PEZI|nr:hypothetical protein AC578_6160 [Pseudocercospora eumusae]